MKRALFILLATLVMVALVVPANGTSAAHEVSQPNARPAQVSGETIRVGTNAEYPPFESVDEDGNIVGFDADLMMALAETAGFEIEWVNTRWDGIFVALSEGEFDAVISAATITEEREEIVDFTNPYFNAGQIIAVSVDNAETITTPEDLAGLRIGVQLGTTGDEYASNIEGAVVQRYDEVTLAFQSLGQGDVDAVIADSPTAADIIANNPDLNLTTVGEPLTTEYYGIAVRPDFPELVEALNVALETVIADGTYAEIYESYFGMDPPAEFMGEDMGMVVLDPTDPASVLLYFFDRAFAGDLESALSVVCEEGLSSPDIPSEDDLALFEGLIVDLSGLEFIIEYNEDETEASATLEGVLTITFEDLVQELSGEELSGDPLLLIKDGDNWLYCPAAE